MADTFNCLTPGQVEVVAMVPDTGAPIHIGDLVFQDPITKKARTAASMIAQGSEALNQGALHDLFAGVAVQRGGALESGEVSFNLNPLPGQIIVAISGTFLFTSTSQTWNPGDLVGGYSTANGQLAAQKVDLVTTGNKSIGIAAPTPHALADGTAKTQVAVRIKSTIFGGGVPATQIGSSSGAV